MNVHLEELKLDTKPTEQGRIANKLSIWKRNVVGILETVFGQVWFHRKLVDVNQHQSQLDPEQQLIQFLQSELEHERTEKEMYRNLFLKGVVPTSSEDAPLASFPNIKIHGHMPWSVAKRELERKLADKKKRDDADA